MQKDQRLDLDEAKDKLKLAGVPEDEMAALERQLAAPAAKDTTSAGDNSSRKVGFVSAGVESRADDGRITTANNEEIELPEEENDSDDDVRVEIAQKDVPDAVFGDLAQKRKDPEEEDPKDKEADSRLGALERIKRLKRG